ncbi:DDE-type integrase/transposase/recombinase, partial [Mesorhizobium sp. PL10]
ERGLSRQPHLVKINSPDSPGAPGLFLPDNNRIEQDHRRIKRRVRPMLGFKSTATASTILSGIEMIHMMCKRQARYAFNPNPSLAEQFEILAT